MVEVFFGKMRSVWNSSLSKLNGFMYFFCDQTITVSVSSTTYNFQWSYSINIEVNIGPGWWIQSPTPTLKLTCIWTYIFGNSPEKMLCENREQW